MPTNFERIKYILTKNPKLLAKLPSKIARKVHKHVHPVASLQLKINKNKRKRTRQINNYENPKRVLIYVIYENQAHLQAYKLFFLEALANLSDKVLIVLNSPLPDQDVEELKKYGREDIMVIVGGVIPAQDYQFLFDAGAVAVFGPGTKISEAAITILEVLLEE